MPIMAADIPHKNPVTSTGHSEKPAEGQQETSPKPPTIPSKTDVVPPYANPYASKRKKQFVLKWGKFWELYR
jgi:hypothetical protein